MLVQGDYRRAADIAQELLAIGRSVGDRETECSALFTLGTVALRQRDHVQASDFLNIASEIGSPRTSSMTLTRLGEIASEQGNYALASQRYRESLSYAHVSRSKQDDRSSHV